MSRHNPAVSNTYIPIIACSPNRGVYALVNQATSLSSTMYMYNDSAFLPNRHIANIANVSVYFDRYLMKFRHQTLPIPTNNPILTTTANRIKSIQTLISNTRIYESIASMNSLYPPYTPTKEAQ